MQTTYYQPGYVKSKPYPERLLAKKNEKMDPLEFCTKWCQLKPGEWGFKVEAVRLLHTVTGASIRTVERWGERFESCPSYVPRLLMKEDILREMEKQIKRNQDL
ncbi:hypothetical protein [Laspinema olomoucense]|uniref:Uncharacterized protein n=1 Tax=Laspinema olomoucense D3b TaxID=2953688 RepID=A0ABT2NIA1_9CYAN|nr:hypothetical protein [Laspinema sp. D3b]MCT7981599.1 hypothetical protein [Laspinema sp. D3b]